MANKTYEAPSVVALGDFRSETGEFFGPFTEYILPFRDYSDEG